MGLGYIMYGRLPRDIRYDGGRGSGSYGGEYTRNTPYQNGSARNYPLHDCLQQLLQPGNDQIRNNGKAFSEYM